MYETNGVYSSKSMYAVVNFRGIQPVFLPAVWDLKVPPRIHIFLWLLSQNKILTRDNLRKRGMPKPLECSFCKDIESVHHLFFECIVARLLWRDVLDIFKIEIVDYESVASKWLCNKRFFQLNFVTSAILWSIWNCRNSLTFNRKTWIGMKQVLHLVLTYLQNWKVPFTDLDGGDLTRYLDLVKTNLKMPVLLELEPD